MIGLYKMQRKRRQKNRNNIVFLTVLIKFGIDITIITIMYKYLILTNLMFLNILIKVFNSFHSNIIISPAILSCANNPT